MNKAKLREAYWALVEVTDSCPLISKKVRVQILKMQDTLDILTSLCK